MRCIWGSCNSDKRYPARCVGVTFIPFVKAAKSKPWNWDRCLRWIEACGRPYDQLNITKIGKNHYICSKHFVDGKPTRENPDPIPAVVVPGQSPFRRRTKTTLLRSRNEKSCKTKMFESIEHFVDAKPIHVPQSSDRAPAIKPLSELSSHRRKRNPPIKRPAPTAHIFQKKDTVVTFSFSQDCANAKLTPENAEPVPIIKTFCLSASRRKRNTPKKHPATVDHKNQKADASEILLSLQDTSISDIFEEPRQIKKTNPQFIWL